MRTEEKLYTVYRLENVVTKKNYIGMTSLEPKERWYREYYGKMKEAIDSFPLDLCWKKHIEFQTPSKEQALELESELMKWYDSVENGYNTSSFDNYKYKRTEEHRKNISEANIGRTFSEESKKKMSEAHIGKHLSEEHKKKMAESHGVNGILQYSKDGEFIAEYPSSWEAERTTGCNQSSICKCCKGKQKTCGGYIWKYA